MSGLDPDYESIQEDMWHDEQPTDERAWMGEARKSFATPAAHALDFRECHRCGMFHRLGEPCSVRSGGTMPAAEGAPTGTQIVKGIVLGYDPHPCTTPGCPHTVEFDDEPWCFKHSPDEGSSVPGYSYKAVMAAGPA